MIINTNSSPNCSSEIIVIFGFSICNRFKSHTVATRLQSLAWGSRSVASIAGLLVSTRMQSDGEVDDFLSVYWLYFAVSLSIPLCGILLPENRRKPRGSISAASVAPPPYNPTAMTSTSIESAPIDIDSPSSSGSQLMDDVPYEAPQYPVSKILYLCFETICRRSIFYPLLFVFILCSTPQSGEAVTYYQIYFLGFTSVQIGYLGAATSFALLIAISILTLQTRKSNTKFSLVRTFLFWTITATILPFITLILVCCMLVVNLLET